MSVHPRIVREKKTIEAMIEKYCSDKHGKKGELCQDCHELLEYAKIRLTKCPFQENKTTCAKCLIRCYRPAMRNKIKKVMRHSGPRMIIRHPILALLHIFDGLKKPSRARV